MSTPVTSSVLHSSLLFAISHYTEVIVEDFESHKRDRLEESIYQVLVVTVEVITPFETFSTIARTLIKYLEHENETIKMRMLQIIQRMIELGPRSITKKECRLE